MEGKGRGKIMSLTYKFVPCLWNVFHTRMDASIYFHPLYFPSPIVLKMWFRSWLQLQRYMLVVLPNIGRDQEISFKSMWNTKCLRLYAAYCIGSIDLKTFTPSTIHYVTALCFLSSFVIPWKVNPSFPPLRVSLLFLIQTNY